MAYAARTLELGPERSLHTVMAGEGQDIVLLHGGFATHQDWLTGIFQSLSRLGRTIAVDRPGHGLSRRPRGRGAPRAQAAQIHDGLRALGVERPVLVAHSLGGLVALGYAEQYPDALSHLVLIGP
ncbi:MAG: alpha/beta hydrolase, partial [Pseudomonadota bacterium]|nr:alpha/beta hydrolase [Pseudomonadota bacterium]